jgi:hypothetical protein
MAATITARCKERGTTAIVPGRLNALIGKLDGEKKEGEKAGRGGIRAAAAAGR